MGDGERILIVDDEPLLAKGLKHRLQQEGFHVKCAYDGEEGMSFIEKGGIDLLILDLMLPKKDGFTLCRELRSSSDIPIIMLTSKVEDIDKILGIEIGADDYITKPFNTRELIARIKALLRRSKMGIEKSKNEIIHKGNIKIDLNSRRVLKNESEIRLTSKEFDILYLLVKNPDRVYSRENLLEIIWGYDFFGDARTVDVHIRRLREKLELDPGKPEIVMTKWGSGYYFREKE